MDKHSPTPWRVENVNQTYHVEAADGGFVALFVSEADAALIVEAVNERDRLRDLILRLVDALGFFSDLENHEIDLLREAREAIGEDAE